MKQYIVLYMADEKAMEIYNQMSQEQQEKDMGAWMAWMEKYKDSFVDAGDPVGKNTRVTKDKAQEHPNHVMGYSIMQADSKDSVVAMVQENNHLDVDGAYIEVMDRVEIPGM